MALAVNRTGMALKEVRQVQPSSRDGQTVRCWHLSAYVQARHHREAQARMDVAQLLSAPELERGSLSRAMTPDQHPCGPCNPRPAQERRPKVSLSPHYPGSRVAQASHLGELLTRGTPRPAPPRDALVRQAAVRADRIGTGQPGTGQEESGNHPLNDLQESILAATHQLRADGHPPNTP